LDRLILDAKHQTQALIGYYITVNNKNCFRSQVLDAHFTNDDRNQITSTDICSYEFKSTNVSITHLHADHICTKIAYKRG
jgi:ribonuclease BN (tRNA processing enzyme)